MIIYFISMNREARCTLSSGLVDDSLSGGELLLRNLKNAEDNLFYYLLTRKEKSLKTLTQEVFSDGTTGYARGIFGTADLNTGPEACCVLYQRRAAEAQVKPAPKAARIM